MQIRRADIRGARIVKMQELWPELLLVLLAAFADERRHVEIIFLVAAGNAALHFFE